MIDKVGTPERIEFKRSAVVEKLEPIDRSHLMRAIDSQPVIKKSSQLDQWTAQVPMNRASILGTKNVLSVKNRKKSTEAVGRAKSKMQNTQRLHLNMSHEGSQSPYPSNGSFNPVDRKSQEPRSQLRVTLQKLNS